MSYNDPYKLKDKKIWFYRIVYVLVMIAFFKACE